MSDDAPLVLAADVGGTNTKIALARFENRALAILERHVYKSGQFESLERVAEAFLARPAVAAYAGAIDAGCFAVAGPVEHGRARLTNLPWAPEEGTITRALGLPRVRLINDFAAAGRGIEHLAPDDLLTLQEGQADVAASRVVVGAGTGLGVALLDWDGEGYEVHASEAGHTDFAPVDDTQVELLAHLRQEFKRVSHERVLCGAGLARLLAFVEARGEHAATPELNAAMAEGDPANAISTFALAGRDEAAARALEIFVCAYGSFAGNMALVMLAHGGVYIAGGIAPKIAPKLRDGSFINAFKAKGRFGRILETMPVHVVMNDHVGLLGALAEAAYPQNFV
jgi:glucokinase